MNKSLQTTPTLRRHAGFLRPQNHKRSPFSPGNSACYWGLFLNSKHTSKSTCICRFERSVTRHHALIGTGRRDWSVKINTGQSCVQRKGAERRPKETKGTWECFHQPEAILARVTSCNWDRAPPNGARLRWVYKVLIEEKRCRSQGDHLWFRESGISSELPVVNAALEPSLTPRYLSLVPRNGDNWRRGESYIWSFNPTSPSPGWKLIKKVAC